MATVRALAPSFGGIDLEDVAALVLTEFAGLTLHKQAGGGVATVALGGTVR